MLASAWSEALAEFQSETAKELQRGGPKPGDKTIWAKMLHKRAKALADHSGRPLVIYATACTSSGKQIPPGGLQIDNSDKIGFYEVTHAIKGKSLDLMIHSPGGSPEAAEAIVESLRSRFSHVRVIVPSYAKSAATMMAMSANEILLEQDAELGPIDPQMITANGYSPAEAIKEQFIKAAGEIASDPRKLSVWIPILQQMGPSLLVQCDNAIALSKTLVKQWLTRFMFEGDTEAEEKASAVADYLGQHSNFKSHGRCIRLADLTAKNLGLKLSLLNGDPGLQTKVWATYCALDVIFAGTGIFKLFFNSNEQALVRAHSGQQFLVPSRGIPQP